MKEYKLNKEETRAEIERTGKDTIACVDIIIADMNEQLSYNKIISKFGKKYWTALMIIAQGELMKWMEQDKMEKINKELKNKL